MRTRVSWRLAATVVAALLLGGCRARTDIVFRRDGSGSYAVTVLVPKDNPITGADERGLGLGDRVDELGFPVRVEKLDTGSSFGERVEFTFTSFGDFRRKVTALDVAQRDLGVIALGTLSRTSGTWTFRFEMPLVHDIDLSVRTMFAPAVRVELALTLPGQPGRHDADAVRSGGGSTTFLWRLRHDGSDAMYAQTVDVMPPAPHGLAVSLIGVDAALLVLAYASARGRRAAEAAAR